MRAYLPAYELISARDLPSALDTLRQDHGLKPFAGGTDIMVLLEAGQLPEERFLDIWALNALRGIEVQKEWVRVGALTTYTDILRHPIMQEEFPMLCDAARVTGAVAIQNRGTLGGNIANASPAADSPPALLAYDARIEVLSTQGMREVSYTDFHTGYKTMNLQPGELIAHICLPRPQKRRSREKYHKVGTRRAQAISKLCMAGWMDVREKTVTNVRIAWGSVAPTPVRSPHVEQLLQGHALTESLIEDVVSAVVQDISPIDDIRSTKPYRVKVAQNILRDFLCSI